MLNYQRKSTSGWQIWNIILDWYGGSLSIIQLVGDSFVEAKAQGLQHSYTGVLGNPAKLGLGLISIFFDVSYFFHLSRFSCFLSNAALQYSYLTQYLLPGNFHLSTLCIVFRGAILVASVITLELDCKSSSLIVVVWAKAVDDAYRFSLRYQNTRFRISTIFPHEHFCGSFLHIVTITLILPLNDSSIQNSCHMYLTRVEQCAHRRSIFLTNHIMSSLSEGNLLSAYISSDLALSQTQAVSNHLSSTAGDPWCSVLVSSLMLVSTGK